MASNIKEKITKTLSEQVLQRKAMFIPMICVSTFALVGYAAADREAPVIESNKIQVLYGTELDAKCFEIEDNRDSSDSLKVDIDTRSFDANQLGNYTVEVTATDLFSNTSTKNVDVEVIDNVAPVIQKAGNGNGYVVDVEAKASNDISKYIEAVDNVDGNVTPFIQANKKLNTSKLGIQTIDVSVTDGVGNKAVETYEFYVSDSKAPTITLKKGNTVTVNYGSKFEIKNYVKVYDSYDGENVDLNIEGTIDTKKEETTQLALTAIDSSDNKTESSLTVKVADIGAPNLSLKKSKVKIKKGSSINLKNYISKAVDNKDGDVKSNVKISGSVNNKKNGTYTITYSVTDKAGNEAKKTLKVTVYTPSKNSGDDIENNAGIAKTALSRKGKRYVSGGTGPNVFDCSGLTQWAYAKNGISLPRTAAAQYSATSRVSKSQLKAGDLVFFAGTTGGKGISHVGIYIGGGKMVHAGTEKTGVVVTSIYSSYWVKHYAGAGRK